MFEDFDDLFNDAFDKGSKDRLKRIKNLIKRLNNFSELNENTRNPHENELGEPDDISHFEEDGQTIKRSIWETEEGLIVKEEIVGAYKERELSLEEKLILAIEEERYEDAIILRDEIKGLNDNNK
jgi:hypothetical protein